jgi:hypothetical protein
MQLTEETNYLIDERIEYNKKLYYDMLTDKQIFRISLKEVDELLKIKIKCGDVSSVSLFELCEKIKFSKIILTHDYRFASVGLDKDKDLKNVYMHKGKGKNYSDDYCTLLMNSRDDDKYYYKRYKIDTCNNESNKKEIIIDGEKHFIHNQ